MSSWAISIVLAIVLLGYVLLKNRKSKVGQVGCWVWGKLSGLFTPMEGSPTRERAPIDHLSPVERLELATKQEQKQAEELRLMLEAKRELMKARAANIQLRKEIAEVSETSVDKPPAPPAPSARKMR